MEKKEKKKDWKKSVKRRWRTIKALMRERDELRSCIFLLVEDLRVRTDPPEALIEGAVQLIKAVPPLGASKATGTT